MMPLCQDAGVAVMPWSPLARGRLTRPWGQDSERLRTDEYGKTLYLAADADRPVVDAVASVAAARGVPMAQVALAWVLSKPWVTAPIVGASRARHLDDAMAALSLSLTPAEINALEEHYLPHAVSGHA